MNRLAVKGDAESVGTSASMCKAVIAVEMKLTTYRSLYQSIRLVFYVTFYVALLLATFVMPQRVRAHGGVIIDSGFTSHFEWLASINPYPITTGEATVTLLVYDITNYDPVNDLQVMLYVGGLETMEQERPGVKLVIDPALYPGDYSATIPLDQVGAWRLRFVVDGNDRSFEVTTEIKVAAAPPDALPGAATTPDIAATATVFAQNVVRARKQNSSSAAQLSPLTLNNPVDAVVLVMNQLTITSFLGAPWWLWGLIAIIPIFMGWILLRSPGALATEEDDDETDVEG